MVPVKPRLALFVALTVVGIGAGALAYQTEAEKPSVSNSSSPATAPQKWASTDLYGDPLPTGALARLGSVRLREEVALLAFSADGKTLISLSQQQARVRHWNTSTGELLKEIVLPISERSLLKSALARSGNIVAVGKERTVSVWDASTGKERRRFDTGGDLKEVLLSPDGKLLIAVVHRFLTDDVRQWNIATGKELPCLGSVGIAETLASPLDGKRLGIVRSDQTVLVKETATGKLVGKIRGALDTLAFSPDGKQAAASGRDGQVKIWNVADGNARCTLGPVASPRLSSLVFSPDGRRLAAGTAKELRIWDIAERKLLQRMPTCCLSLAFTPDGKTIASASNGAIHLWDTASGAEITPRPGHDWLVHFLAASPDGRSIASIANNENRIYLWDSATGKMRRILAGHEGRATACVFSRDGKLLVSGGKDGTVRFWDISTGKQLRKLAFQGEKSRRGQCHVLALAFSPREDWLAALTEEDNQRRLHRWKTATGEDLPLRMLPSADSWIDFSADHNILVLRSNEIAIVGDVGAGDEAAKFSLDYNSLAISPDGQVLAVKPDSESITLVDRLNGGELLRIKTEEGGSDWLAFAPDGRTLAAVGGRGIRLWNAATGRELFRRPFPQTDRLLVSCLTFLPGGDRLATGLWDGTILTWDLQPKTWRAGIDVKDLDGPALERLWSELAAGDDGKAHRAVWTLAAVPSKTIPFLNQRLAAAPTIDAAKVQRLIGGLESAQFTVRQTATERLTALGEGVVSDLRQARSGKPSLEKRKRLQMIEAEIQEQTLRRLRAVRALEHIGDREARQVLQKLAAGDPAARATRQAKESLQRLQRRDARQ